jgi:TonB-dependent receptor
MGQEVVITGQLLGQAKAINQQLSAESIANIVSSDRIQELPDVNAAEAIARLPGVAINRSGGEGTKIVIRGLEPKFNAITVNGVRMPANSANDRSVDLSLISPEMLDGIEVFKSPLPDMDGEAIGGTVNLKLRKAPAGLKMLGKLLGGYNNLNNDLKDYKGVFQVSDRVFNKNLGIVAQGSAERFNRGGDIVSYSWRQGRTDPATGNTAIDGNTLAFEDGREIRERLNGSVNLDYTLKKHTFSLFGIYSQTDRNQFSLRNSYNPVTSSINYESSATDNSLKMNSVALSATHPVGKLLIDWSLSNAVTVGKTPYDFSMRFVDEANQFDASLNRMGHPRTFFDAANPDLNSSFLRSNDYVNSQTKENSKTALCI